MNIVVFDVIVIQSLPQYRAIWGVRVSLCEVFVGKRELTPSQIAFRSYH